MGYPEHLGPDPEPSTAEHIQKLRARFGALVRSAIERGQPTSPSELNFEYQHFRGTADYLVHYERQQWTVLAPETAIEPDLESPIVILGQPLSGREGNKLFILGKATPRLGANDTLMTDTQYWQVRRTRGLLDEVEHEVEPLKCDGRTPLIKDDDGYVSLAKGTDFFKLRSVPMGVQTELDENYADDEVRELEHYVAQASIELDGVLDAVLNWELKNR